MRTMMRRTWSVGSWAAVAVGLVATLIVDATRADAQRPTRRRQSTIEIRGTVPTPQVVTVRPRSAPEYNRQVLVPRFYDHDFWPDIQEGYAIMSDRLGTVSDTMALAVANVGTPDLFRLPSVSAPTGLRSRFATMRKQFEWCAPRWWCPSHRVRVQVPADSAALFERRLPPGPVANVPMATPGANLRPDQMPQVQQRWCTPHWWCPPGGVITTPPSTTPDSTRRPPTPADTTRRPPPGTSSASASR